MTRQRRGACQPGATPRGRGRVHVPPCKGGGFLRPCRAHRSIPKPRALPWATMRRNRSPPLSRRGLEFACRETCNRKFFFALVPLDQHRHGHESQNENQDCNGGPDQPRAVERLPLMEQRGMAETEPQQKGSPQIPSGPEQVSERNQEQRDGKRHTTVILARRCVEDMSAIELPAREQVE